MSLFDRDELYAIITEERPQKVTRKEFLAWLSDFIAPLKEQIAAANLLPKEQREERVQRAREDFEFFRRTYFPHYYTLPGKSGLAEHLEGVYKSIANADTGQKFAIAAPRGFGKSTDVSVVFPIWCVLFGIKRFITIFSDAVELTETLIEAIKAELEENPNLAQDFPDATGIGPTWKVGEIVTKNGVKIKGFGSGKRVRGVRHGVYRPDLAIIDDLENDENVRSLAQRDKLEEWLDSAIDNLGSVKGDLDILYIGTILHRDSVLARKLRLAFWHPKIFRAIITYPKRMDLWDIYERLYRGDGAEAAHAFYTQNKAKMDEGAKLLWDAVSLESLMQKRAASPRAFERELQNNPASEEQTFDSAKFTIIPPAKMPRLTKKFLFTDFKGDSKAGDYTAFVAGGLDERGEKLYVYYANRSRIKGKEAVEFLADLYAKERFYLIGGEKNGGFFLYLDWFKDVVRKKFGLVPNIKILHNSRKKEDRIAELEFPITGGDIVFVGEHPELFRELEEFPESRYDDLSDALAGLWELARKKRARKRRTRYKRRTF